MMIETLMFLAAAATQAPSAPDCAQAAGQAPGQGAAIDPAIIEMTYNAFVAVEETPSPSELARPTILFAPNKQSALAGPGGTAWIS